MLKFEPIVILLQLFWHSVRCQDNCTVLSDPRVFDAVFYLNNYPDLEDIGLETPQAAVEHWCSIGIDEGRQASSVFHSVQYVNRYPDLEETFPGDWRGATRHYVINGYEEGRIGYTDGGSNGRWTVRSANPVTDTHFVHISTSERVAGAIDSLVWKNKEFINSYDHGRQFQLALTVPPYGECWNPTEAGGRADGTGMSTHSIIQSIQAAGNVLTTISHSAYWFLPNTTAARDGPAKCMTGDPALNELPTHPFNLDKTVTIGCFGMDNCMQFEMDVDMGSGYGMPTDFEMGQLEAPTAYLMTDFNNAKRWNYNTGELIDANDGEDIFPVIIHTEDGLFALGGYHPPHENLRYAYFNFNIQGFPNGTYKWSVVWRDRSKQPGDHITLTSWSCVGDLDMVVSCLTTIRNSI